MKVLRQWWVLCVLLTACATSASFEQRLAQAYSVNTAIRTTSAAALDAGRISSEDMEQIIAINDQVRVVLDQSADGDEQGLALALEIMQELERYSR